MHKVLLRADADMRSGTGDLFSLIYISQYFNGWERYFFTKDTKEARSIFRNEGVGRVKYIARGTLSKEEIDLLNDFIKREKIDVVFIEITAGSISPYRDIKAPFKVCVNFDGNIPEGFNLIINWDVKVDALYDKRRYPYASFLLGPQYAFLRKDIFDMTRKLGVKTKRRARAKNILIFFGGYDEFDLTIKLVRSLEKINPELSLNIIVGTGYRSKNRLIDCLKKSRFHNYKVRQNAKNIWKEHSKTDLAIISGGLILFEAVALNVPTAIIATYEHQIKRSIFFERTKTALYLGFRRYNISKLKRAINGYPFEPFKKRISTNAIPQIIYERLGYKGKR